MEIENENFIQFGKQYLQQMKDELDNNETCSESDELKNTDDLPRFKKEVQRCYEETLDENSKIIKNQMDENNQVTNSYRKLAMKHNKLICALQKSENNVKHLQKELSLLRDIKSKSGNDKCMTERIASLESDLRRKTTELDDERLCVKRLKDTIEERFPLIEGKLKRCPLKQESSVGCSSNENTSSKPCSSNDELCHLNKKNKKLQMEIENKNKAMNVYKNKFYEAKGLLKQIRVSLKNSIKQKYEPFSVEKYRLKRPKLSTEKLCKPKVEDACCTTERVKKQAVANICCKTSTPCCKPSPPCSKPSTPCCKPSTPCCKPSLPCCEPSTPCCKPSPPCCDPSTPCCKPSPPCCKPSTPCCKPSPPCCKPSPPCCEPSPPCCKPSTPCCEPSTPCCKPSPPCCKPSPPCCEPSTPCCKPSTPCCKSVACTCKIITCTCKMNPCTCKIITCTCKMNPCTCKTSICCSSCEIPPNKSKKITTDKNGYTNQLQKILVELKDLKSDMQQLSKVN